MNKKESIIYNSQAKVFDQEEFLDYTPISGVNYNSGYIRYRCKYRKIASHIGNDF